MAQIVIQCACGRRGTYHRVWVQGFRLFSEDSVIVWYDPKTKDDPKVSIQRNTGHSVCRCLNCAFDAEKRDREAEEARPPSWWQRLRNR